MSQTKKEENLLFSLVYLFLLCIYLQKAFNNIHTYKNSTRKKRKKEEEETVCRGKIPNILLKM